MSVVERSPFNAKPLSAEEYHTILNRRRDLVLRVSDGTRDGTFRFWVHSGELCWQCLSWATSQLCNQTHFEAVLDDVPEDATTQLLIERSNTDTDQPEADK